MLRFLERSPAAEAAAHVMESRTAHIFADLLLHKPADPRARTAWHQDEPQWTISGLQLSSVWLTLDPVTPETGSLRFVAGSHHGPYTFPT